MMALQASVRGDHLLAASLIGAAEVAREASGDHLVPWQQPLLDQAIVTAQANLGDDHEARFMEGRRLTMNQSIALIMERFDLADKASAAVSPEGVETLSLRKWLPRPSVRRPRWAARCECFAG